MHLRLLLGTIALYSVLVARRLHPNLQYLSDRWPLAFAPELVIRVQHSLLAIILPTALATIINLFSRVSG